MLAHPRAPHGHRLALDFPQRATEGVALFGQPGITDEEVRRLTAHLLDHVAAGCPQVAEVGYVGLNRERVDSRLAQRLDQIEPVGIAAVEVHRDAGGAIQSGSQGKRLPETAVLAGAGNQDTPARDAGGERIGEAKFARINAKAHDRPPRFADGERALEFIAITTPARYSETTGVTLQCRLMIETSVSGPA